MSIPSVKEYFQLFGLTTPQTVSIQWPRTLEGIRFDDPVETARRLTATHPIPARGRPRC